MTEKKNQAPRSRRSALDMPADEFRSLGHALVDQIAAFYESFGTRELTREAGPEDSRVVLGTEELPEQGTDAGTLRGEFARRV